MSGNELNKENNVDTKEIRSLLPQMLWLEFVAWVAASSASKGLTARERDMNLLIAHYLNWTVSKLYTSSIARSEMIFASPANSFINRHNNEQGFFTAIFRYFAYVWIDATSTSGVVTALSIRRLDKPGVQSSRLNVLYPWLVTIPGAILKIILGSIAVAAAIIMAPLAAVADILGFSQTASAINKGILAGLGIVSTALISNINPVFLFKTVFVDPFLSLSVINKLNIEAREYKTKQKDLPQEANELNIRNTSSTPNIHKEHIAEINATFANDAGIRDGLRTDMVTKATKMFSSAYVIKPKLSAWDPRNFARKELVLEIRSADNKKILGTIHTKISGSNNLKLQFTKEADAYTQDILAVGFTKMIQEISHMANSKEPIKLDISNSYATEERITANIRGLNKSIGVVVKFEDRKRETSTDRISDEIEDKPEALTDDVPDEFKDKPKDYRIV